MHDYRSIDNWLYHACKDIRYAPDHAAVQAELRAHYEDAFDALAGSGMTEADAKELALRGLGDADELSPALAKAHNSIDHQQGAVRHCAEESRPRRRKARANRGPVLYAEYSPGQSVLRLLRRESPPDALPPEKGY